MGLISTKFFDKPSTRATLEKIEQELQTIEERRWDKVKREQFIVQILSFLPTTILIANICILVYPSDSTWRDKLILSVPIVILNLILLVCRKMVQWYSRWSLDSEEARLRKLQKEKKRILEMVCETESYRVATELLEKYDPKQLRRRERPSERPTSPLNNSLTKFSASPLRSPKESSTIQRQHSFSHPQQFAQPRLTQTIAQNIPSILNQTLQVPAPPIPAPPPPTPVAKHPSRSNLNTTVANAPLNASMSVAASSVQGRPVRPVLSKDRTFFERVVDWVIADGPDNRFALICRFCYGHNGMSLAEEFETINFRCCYCYNLNTATNKRQVHDQLQPDRERSESAISRDQDAIAEPDNASEEKSKPAGNGVHKTTTNTKKKDSAKKKKESLDTGGSPVEESDRLTAGSDLADSSETEKQDWLGTTKETSD